MASILTEWFVPHSPLREERKVGVVIDSASGLKALEWAQKYLVLSQPNDKFFIIGVKPRNNTTENDREYTFEGMEAIDQEEDEQAHDQATSKGRWENVKSKAFVFKEICVTKVYRKDNTDLATLRQAITDFGLNVLVVGRQTVLGIITELMEEPTCTIVVVKDDTPARDEENGKEKLLRSSSKKRKGSDDPTPVASTSKINS
ncbi:hypothetical protein GQ55_8G164700 [Panicum hallii var. hallii]|uniref:Uncharacterized protein n=1 Tax=Panicum hallii var. hallii TaxID=1504633 RepID=A0A2T7CND2_9POAL|nr:hypothetical protein GQ55_8G164700 [Panicum hallii var. hallii]